MIVVDFVFVFAVSTTIAFCIDALFAWCCSKFRIMVSRCVGLMMRSSWCVVFYAKSVSV